MRALTILLFLLAPRAAHAQVADPLAPIAFLEGELEGKGSHPWGEYDETLTGTRELGGQVLVVRSSSTMGGRTVFEDLRVISWDGEALRMRQWAMGDLAVYRGEVRDGVLVFSETAHEGSSRPEWRYVFERDGDAVRYRVEQRGEGGRMQPYLSGRLARKIAGPDERGPYAVERRDVRIPVEGARLAARAFLPAGEGPHPAVVFSPGGRAGSVEGYDAFGDRFASWGFATLIVAFDTPTAAERAERFAAVAAWAAEELPVDAARLVAAGHSRGGEAALLAAHADERFAACLALAPSGPAELAGERALPACVVVGGADELEPLGRDAFAALRGPRVLVSVEGMDHMFAPGEAGFLAMAHATAFLTSRVADRSEHAAWLAREREGVSVTSAE